MDPSEFAVNAWVSDGKPATSPVADEAQQWALGDAVLPTDRLAPALSDPADWSRPDVGWGLILPERPNTSRTVLASGADAPPPIQRLLRERPNSPVFRYIPDWDKRFEFFRNYRDCGDVAISGSGIGIGKGQLPAYLLIYGSPEEIPWSIQYILNTSFRRSVGRLDLEGEALENYISALLDNWQGSESASGKAVIWAVDHGDADITRLMRNAVANKVHSSLGSGVSASFVDGTVTRATEAALTSALENERPGLIVTTSHGQTGPLADPKAMLANLGLPVDQDHKSVGPAALLQSWQPDGAIWYAHACCSAGSSEASLYSGVVSPGSVIADLLEAVAGLGAHVAPLPRALLGARKPLRAFVGHVEPTFNWTLENPKTGQFLTDGLVTSLAKRVTAPYPIGHSFQDLFGTISSTRAQYDAARADYLKSGSPGQMDSMIRVQLQSRDVQSTVILGDPTAMLT